MKNNKITIEEFWNSKKKIAIHCDTEEKANKLLKAFDKLGKKWAYGDSYLEKNCWNGYEEYTCYSNNNGYTSINWYKKNDYKIYEFEDVIIEEKKMKRKIKLRDLTPKQWDENKEIECKNYKCCNNCKFRYVYCDASDIDSSWINHKELYSDKFLDQEIEIEMSDILDKKEKEYLSAVIKPFRDRVISIEKAGYSDFVFLSINIHSISVLRNRETINLPFFQKDMMYKNMIDNFKYTLEELDL